MGRGRHRLFGRGCGIGLGGAWTCEWRCALGRLGAWWTLIARKVVASPLRPCAWVIVGSIDYPLQLVVQDRSGRPMHAYVPSPWRGRVHVVACWWTVPLRGLGGVATLDTLRSARAFASRSARVSRFARVRNSRSEPVPGTAFGFEPGCVRSVRLSNRWIAG